MKELLKHLPAIKGFIEERTTAFQEISDNVLKNFLKEAYKLPFLFPVRIIVSEDKFVNFLFDMRKDLFEGKKIEITDNSEKNEESKTEVSESQEDSIVKEKKTVAKKEIIKKEPVKSVKTNKTASTTKTKSSVATKETKAATTTKKATTAKNTKTPAKKEKLVS